MAKTVIDINEEALVLAAEELGTKTKKDTVNAALEAIAARRRRVRALEEWISLGQAGAFDELLKRDFEEEAWR